MASRRFRPSWWSLLLVAALSASMLRLGFWQIHRGEAKAALIQQYADAASAPPQPLDAHAVANAETVARGQVQGYWDGTRQLLLDGQTHDHTPGYHVWTPLRLADGGLVMVDRGWVAAPVRRSELPDISVDSGQAVTVSGYWRPWPRPGLRLGGTDCARQAWPRVVQYPTIEELRCLYPDTLADGLLLMDADLPNGYVRDWSVAPEMPPERHYAYAFQWFALSATLVVLFVVFNLKRRS